MGKISLKMPLKNHLTFILLNILFYQVGNFNLYKKKNLTWYDDDMTMVITEIILGWSYKLVKFKLLSLYFVQVFNTNKITEKC